MTLSQSPPDIAKPALTPLERAVIDLSRKDPLWSLARRSGVAIWLLGRRHDAQPLANPRLEALRRYAILRRQNRDGGQVAGVLRESGYSPAQIAAIDRLARMPFCPERRVARRPVTPVTAALGIALILPLAFWSGCARAQAQPPIDAPIEVPPEGELGGPPGGPGDDNHIAIGLGGAYMPAYQGASKYRFQPLPALDIKLGRFFANFQDGIGATAIDNDLIAVGAGVVIADNYRARDAPKGIGNVPFGAGARGFVKLRQAGFEAAVGATKIFAGGTRGFLVDASLSHPIMVSEKLMLNPSIGTTWADRKHLNRYFGVNAAQSVASGLPQYRLKSGFVDAKAEVAAQYRLTDHIGIGMVGGVSTLFGDAKDSPIVKERTRPYGIFFASYSF